MVSIGTTWDRTVDFVRDNMGALAPVVLATQFAPAAVSGSFDRLRMASTGGTSLALNLLTLAVTVIAMWGALYLTGFAAQDDKREQRHVARGIATKRFMPLVGVSILLFLIVVVIFVPAGLLAVASGFDFSGIMAGREPDPAQFATLGWTFLYVFVAAIFMVWLFARLLPVTAVVAMERRGVGAIGRTFALTRGMALKLVGLLILYGIVAAIGVSAARFVFGGIFALFGAADSSVSIGDIAAAIAVSAVSAILALYQSAFVGKLYRGMVGDEDKTAVFA